MDSRICILNIKQVMSTFDDRWKHVARIRRLAVLMLLTIGCAQAQDDKLKKCLHDLDGIEWQLPYQPPMRIVSCASQFTHYGNAAVSGAGGGELVLADSAWQLHDAENLSMSEKATAAQCAIYFHFDDLFRRHGYRQVAPPVSETGYVVGDAVSCVRIAHYERPVLGTKIMLTYESERSRNTTITFQGLSPLPNGTRGN
jgi:hypothetical protein